MKRILLVVAALAMLAASPGEVVPELESQGFYIEAGSNASPEVVGDAVAEAGFSGGRFYVVVLSEEPGSGATFFADAVLDDLGSGTVLTVAPETVGYASDGTSWSAEELDGAVNASLNGTSDDDVVVRFVESLTGAPVGGGSTGSGGTADGSSGIIWLVVFVGGLAALFFYLRSRSQEASVTARAGRLAEFRAAAQEKLNAVANDILEMEAEVTMSEKPEVQQHYNSASAKYAEIIDRVSAVDDPEELLDLTYQLDIAIWELDVAEAYLDGKTPPKKPSKPKIEEPEGKPGAKAGPVINTSPRPTYDRRPQRQSSPAGPDLGNILLAILAARGMSGGGNYSGRWTGGPARGSGGRNSGGGSRGGGTRRMGGGGGGRIRGGGRRGG
ncbi:MAG: hypothetical protein WDZ96_07540 [Acidimicrobiia bacterium]